jgi:hypothetical protein
MGRFVAARRAQIKRAKTGAACACPAFGRRTQPGWCAA